MKGNCSVVSGKETIREIQDFGMVRIVFIPLTFDEIKEFKMGSIVNPCWRIVINSDTPLL